MNHPPTCADWAKRYIDAFDLALVAIEPGKKAPKGKAWNKAGGYFSDADQAAAFWLKHPHHNMGVVLGPSQLCSLDVDDVQWTRQLLSDQLGVDLDHLALTCPTVVGNPQRMRLLFRVPVGIELGRHALAWPNQKDPDGSLFKSVVQLLKAAEASADQSAVATLKAQAEALKRFTVFEFRAGLVQDVLPPSIHPGTGKPYVWKTPPSIEGFPVLIPQLLNAWKNWDLFKRDAETACPWWVKTKPSPKTRTSPTERASPSVIEQFNRAHDVESLLTAHGYTQHGHRWLCPQSSTGLPGVSVTDGKVYSHHGADPLANGHQNDAFAVFCLLEHGGDVPKAVKAAACLLEFNEKPASKTRTPGKPPKPVPVKPATDWKSCLRRTEDNVLRAELTNAYLILKHAPEWQGVLAFNEFSCRIEKLKLPPVFGGEVGPWLDVDAGKTLVWLQMVWNLRLRSSLVVEEAAQLVACDARFHPVREWLERLPPWDGQPRLPHLLPTVFGTEDNDYTRHIGQSLLVSSVARVMQPGCKVDEMVVLEGGQGLGKSTCVAELFGFEWYLETSEPPSTKDFYVTMQGHTVVEIGEMQSFSKADINQVKMAITRRDDKYRAPYERHGESHPRQCIFIGTTNADTYLRDPTGARRFLPVLVSKADVEYIRQWRGELWAEALHLYLTNFQWWDYPQELAREEQDARYVEDPWEEIIINYLDGHAPQMHYPDGLWGPINEITIMKLLRHALQIEVAKMNKSEQQRVGEILRRLGWFKSKQKRVSGTPDRVRPYLRPQARRSAA
ncbi:VapE domain-containing protein [Pseudomonas fragi]|uniref:VapE domain-containing protein n=1 Tax=Pseudomonas fragi TaxID=296 RepID=UPI0030AC73A1